MADFHLYIHLDEVGESSAMAGGAENKSESASSGGDATAKGIQSAAKKIVSYAALKATAEQVISGNFSMVELSTGAAEYEQRLQTGYNIGKQIWNSVEAVAIGGKVGGLPGAAVAAVGVAVSWARKGISAEFSNLRLRKEKNLENISIGLMNIRAGTAGRRSRDQ